MFSDQIKIEKSTRYHSLENSSTNHSKVYIIVSGAQTSLHHFPLSLDNVSLPSFVTHNRAIFYHRIQSKQRTISPIHRRKYEYVSHTPSTLTHSTTNETTETDGAVTTCVSDPLFGFPNAEESLTNAPPPRLISRSYPIELRKATTGIPVTPALVRQNMGSRRCVSAPRLLACSPY